MEVIFYLRALKELGDFDMEIQDKFRSYFRAFESDISLRREKLKKLSGQNLFEFRVKVDKNIYRAIGAIREQNMVVLVVFQKKTNKIPKDVLKLAQNRLKDY